MGTLFFFADAFILYNLVTPERLLLWLTPYALTILIGIAIAPFTVLFTPPIWI